LGFGTRRRTQFSARRSTRCREARTALGDEQGLLFEGNNWGLAGTGTLGDEGWGLMRLLQSIQQAIASIWW
jgi:hypothetical protein